MTTGNSAAMTVSVAGVAPAITKSACEELDKKNKDEREKAVQGLKQESAKPGHSATRQKELKSALSKAEGGGMTFSSAQVNVGVGGGNSLSGVATGCSNAKARECTSGSLVDGGTSDMKNGKEGTLCGDPAYQHPPGGAGAHGEAKIFNELTQRAKAAGGSLQGGSVLLNIDWRYKQPDGHVYESGMPCRLCYRMMCHAAQKCGIEIHICDKDNKPQPFNPDKDCDKEGKDPANDPYDRLDKRLGEDPYKGIACLS